MGVKDMSLRYRLLLGGTAIVLVPLILMGALIYLNSAHILEDISKVQAVQIAKSISGMIDIALKREIGVLETIAADPDFIHAASSGQYSLLNSKLAYLYLKLGAGYEGLAVFNKEGIISADGSDINKIGISVAERDYVRQSRVGVPVIGSPVPSRATGEPIFGISAPIMSDNGIFLGGVVGIVKADFLVTYISSLKLGKTGYYFLLDSKGVVIAHPVKEYILKLDAGREEGLHELTGKMIRQETGAGEYIYKGIKRIAGFAPVKLTGWSVGVAQHRDEIIALAYANRNLAMFVAIIFLIMTITAVFYFSGAVSVPVQKTLDTLNKAIEQASEAVIIIGLDRKIQFVNPAMARIIDKPINDLVGRIPELGNTDMEGSEEVWKILEQGRVWSGSVSGVRRDSSGYTMELTVTPVWEAGGKISCFLAVGKDVTRELRMEAQLRQSQKMEAIGTLAGGIAHDFNNILSAVFGYSELAQRSLSDREKACLYLDEILKAAGRARDLVKHIMTFSRQAEQQKKKFQPKYVIREALKLLRASLPSTIEIDEAVKSDSFIIADPTQIHQIVMNLCTNAGYAMKDHGGTLKVALEDYKVDQEFAERQGIKKGEYLMLQVSDTGKGIPTGIVERIFDPFFTTKPHGEGTGLGLSVVHGIVKAHGGSITVESKAGKGTTFTIYLPAESCDTKDSGEGYLSEISGGSERLILVDDEEPLMLAEKGLLEDLGYHISGFTKSEQALEAFMNDPMSFDAVITDYTMPRMTGYELAIKIRELRADIPVIICTGYIDSEVESRIKLAGINDFVKKPVTRREFGMALRRVLGSASVK